MTGTAVDRAGNTSPATVLTVHVDADAPAVSFTACPSSVLLGSQVSLDWTASDEHSGLATAAAGSVPVGTATVGTRTLTASATDNVGHATTESCTLDVIYDFSGFFVPVANPPTQNKAIAGKIIPVTFSLAGNQGLDIFAAGFPASAPITCATNPQLTIGDPTNVTPPGLTYAASADGRYTYPWKTDKAWQGTCRQFILKLDDGTYHRANFAFK